MIQTIASDKRAVAAIPEGHVRTLVDPTEHRTRVEVLIVDVDRGKARRFGSADRTYVVYVLEGADATIAHTTTAETKRTVGRRAGVYLEPGEAAVVAAPATPLRLLVVSVPKYTGKSNDSHAPQGYIFEEAQLRSLVDEKQFRERTFWVNKETGLSESWDMQLGRMLYAPRAHSPRHVHHPRQDSAVTPEHFYLIEEGVGEVKHDSGSLPVGPGSLVLIPAGEWHQLVASDTGFDYIEFQAPFDFVTTMDHDPLGKNWYIKGTDDGTGKPTRWVQS